MNKTLEKILGDPNKKALKQLQKDVDAINSLESTIQSLSDADLRAKTDEFRKKLTDGATLDDIAHEAFAVVREAARRTLGQRHYDVQLIGGMTLHSGKIAEMRTGEGKTLSATTAVYLNALEGKGAHMITVNDYLALRDADWMGQVYHFLGLTVGCIQAQSQAFRYEADIEAVRRQTEDMGPDTGDTDTSSTEGEGYEALVTADMNHMLKVERADAYKCDITFGTNNEFGFDYLRDNMVQRPEQRVQRSRHFAIIDEVDSILIDEARTPLIISAPAQDATQQYYQFATLVGQLQPEKHFTVDEKMNAANLTEEGIKKIEQALGVENVYVEAGMRTVHHIEQALKARALFTKDKDYVVRDGEVVIIDEFTGRMMEGRRYSEGLHQAIEAKENVKIQQESRTLATITLQNYFRLYDKLAGMTGTAATESEEFGKIYGLDVVVIPTHRDIARKDQPDRVYKNREGKFRAVINHVKELNAKGQPVLIGTISIEQNEYFSQMLTAGGIQHEVLNAKNHEREAEIIAQAGRRGAVTLATNMAGRGVDIILGGNPVDVDEARAVRELGGLAVVGTERHESRRIDNQLRGRSGRQGDPGYSVFFVSMDDELLRVFGSERMQNMMTTLGVPDDMPIENRMVSRSIESAQKKVESRNFDIRKHLVEYDDVLNKQRDAIYRQRDTFLDANDDTIRAEVDAMITAEIEHLVAFHAGVEAENSDAVEENTKALNDAIAGLFPLPSAVSRQVHDILVPINGQNKLAEAEMRTKLIELYTTQAENVFKEIDTRIEDATVVAGALRSFALRAIDTLWIEHLDQMSFLRDSIGLQGYGQRDPLVEYKRESFQVFQQLQANIQKQIVQAAFQLKDAQIERVEERQQRTADEAPDDVEYQAPDKEMQKHGEAESQPVKSDKATNDSGQKIGRNDPCFCGSGKKYKKCHGV